jgi:hypothetical protein
VDVLSDQSKIAVHVVCTLTNINRFFPGVEQTLAARGVEPLVNLLSDNRFPDLCKNTLKTLWNLSNHPAGKEKAIEAGAVPAIALFLLDSDLDVRRCATGALSAIANDEQGKLAILNNPRAVSGLSQLLLTNDGQKEGGAFLDEPTVAQKKAAKSLKYKFGGGEIEGTHEDVVANSCLTVQLASENMAAKQLFTRTLLEDASVLHMVFGPHSSITLNELLYAEEEDVRRKGNFSPF